MSCELSNTSSIITVSRLIGMESMSRPIVDDPLTPPYKRNPLELGLDTVSGMLNVDSIPVFFSDTVYMML